MGTYLSTPITEKGREEGQSNGKVKCAWGVVDMQGWRKTMEDSHVARTDVMLHDAIPAAHIFAVFDGHGGPEVARFTALYLVSVLQQQLLADKNKNDNDPGGAMGPALVQTFHALDRMIDDPNRRDELVRLRAMAPAKAEQREALVIPPLPVVVVVVGDATAVAAKGPDHLPQSLPPPHTPAPPEIPARSVTPEGGGKTVITEWTTSKIEETANTNEQIISNDEEDADSLEPEGIQEASETDQDLSSSDEEDLGPAIVEMSGTDSTDSFIELEAPAVIATDETDPAAVEPPQASAGEVLEQNSNSAAGKVSGMFQRLLKMSGPSGHVVLQVGKNGVITTAPRTTSEASLHSPTASTPSIVRNGQMMCNLPDHPIHAGATAIVAVVAGNVLTVANAGDSRAVLCRGGGVTVPLSFDHKPMQVTEMTRIRHAGGFVNSFGRVNGNLNLSRSIGDLKYKQVPGLSPAQQMITADPDILEYVF